MTLALMLQGTGSSVGKSLPVAGLCRALTLQGLRLAEPGADGAAAAGRLPEERPVRRLIPSFVMRGLDPRTYPLRRPDDVQARGRVGPRVKPGDDGLE